MIEPVPFFSTSASNLLLAAPYFNLANLGKIKLHLRHFLCYKTTPTSPLIYLLDYHFSLLFSHFRIPLLQANTDRS